MRTHTIPTINKSEDIGRIQAYNINHYYWDSLLTPTTTAQIAYLEGKGFIIHMATDTPPHPALYTRHQDPVYKDNAMECFISFTPTSGSNAYFNFEINGNGAVLAAYGPNRHNRQPLSTDQIHQLKVQTTTTNSGWTLTFFIPMTLIQTYTKDLKPNNREVTFNFCKICETESHLHFASLAPLNSKVPNFHLPDAFIKAHY